LFLLFKPYKTRKVLNDKIFYYNVLKNSQDKLRDAMKNGAFHLKNSKCLNFV